MLVVPFGQDQPDNARRCVRLGVARTIDRRHFSVRALLRQLGALAQPAYATAASRVGEAIRAENGTAFACDAIERVLAGQ
jgi:UDP:flavonoid glycosyltransferase YjiC (YdhE family)